MSDNKNAAFLPMGIGVGIAIGVARWARHWTISRWDWGWVSPSAPVSA